MIHTIPSPSRFPPKSLFYQFISSTAHHQSSSYSSIKRLLLQQEYPELNNTIRPPLLKQYPDNTICKPANLLLNSKYLIQSRQIHAYMITTHFLQSHKAPFHWNNIIRSYTRLNSPSYALSVYLHMSRAGVLPDHYTLPITIKAAGQVCTLRSGRQFHAVAIRFGLDTHEFVESALINLYAKAGDFEVACKLFDESPDRKLGSWNAIIAALTQNDRSSDALDMFLRMSRVGIEPDAVTMVSVTSACGGLGDLVLAQQLHKFVFQVKFRRDEDLLMVNSVIDMYGKCGRMDLAKRVFMEMDQRSVSSWTSMIVGYANHGESNEAMECFHAMIEANVKPNHVTFLGVLSACVHGGMVDEGRHWFEEMKMVYGIKPDMKHYGCMVDLLGRAGLLEEARNVVKEMPMKANTVIWGSLLAACERCNDVTIGEWVAKHFLEIEPGNDGVYVVLSNIYANRDMWEEVERIREVMKQTRLPKIQAYSSAIAHSSL